MHISDLKVEKIESQQAWPACIYIGRGAEWLKNDAPAGRPGRLGVFCLYFVLLLRTSPVPVLPERWAPCRCMLLQNRVQPRAPGQGQRRGGQCRKSGKCRTSEAEPEGGAVQPGTQEE